MSVHRLSSSDASTSATFLTLDTPAETTPGMAVALTGTYQGDPLALDYNFGFGWIEASSPTFTAGIFSFTVPGGFPAGTYTPEIRDHSVTSVSGSAGQFVVSAWTPETLATSPGAKAVFEFNAGNPADIIQASSGSVSDVVNSLDTAQFLKAELASGGNPIAIANNSGADGKSRVLQFHASKISASTYDASTDWLGAGGVNGSAGSTLVNLANSPDLATSGSFTTIIALDINKSYSYEAGPIWGTLASPGPLQYAQLRYNNGTGEAGAQVTDSSLVGASAQGTISAGWHVMTMIKSGGTLEYRLDGQPIASTTITSTHSFAAADFLIGGGFPPASSASAGEENGVPPPYVGEFQAYSGVLSGTDLGNAEKLAGNSIGLSLTPNDPPCFAAGTLIRTSRGDVAAEDLQAGDVAVTRRDGRDHPSGIVWVGQRKVDVAAHPQPGRVRPIRLEAGALGEGLPSRPLLLSPDHALLLDGMLIAARQLVNGGSIAVMDVPTVHYVHIELERHGILLAEDVEAESYLDTGNRGQFVNGGSVVALHPDFSRTNHPGACAPLVTDAARVRPVWQRLAQRAALLGHALAGSVTTSHADLRLLLPNGQFVSPAQVLADGRHVFMLHRETLTLDDVWLCSRHNAPNDVRPWDDDRRQLGVAVRAIEVWTRSNGLTTHSLPLDGTAFSSGWHQLEAGPAQTWRWTDGHARLVLPPECVRIDVAVFATADYLAEDQDASSAVAAHVAA